MVVVDTGYCLLDIGILVSEPKVTINIINKGRTKRVSNFENR